MNTATNSGQSDSTAPRWQALPTAVAGVLVLLVTWYFYGTRLQAPDTAWYAWIRPILLAFAALLSIIAAVLLAARRPGGREVLQLAIGIIPLVLASGLVILALRSIGGAADWIGAGAAVPSFGAIRDQLRSSPLRLAINVALIAAVVLLGILGRAGKRDER